MIYDTLKRLQSETERKPAMYIYQDEKNGQIKEKPLPLPLSSAASALTEVNAVKSIHKFMFGC